MASPLRAIADLIYLRKEIRWATSAGIEEDDLLQLHLIGFDEVYESIRNRRTQAYLAGLRKELKG